MHLMELANGVGCIYAFGLELREMGVRSRDYRHSFVIGFNILSREIVVVAAELGWCISLYLTALVVRRTSYYYDEIWSKSLLRHHCAKLVSLFLDRRILLAISTYSSASFRASAASAIHLSELAGSPHSLNPQAQNRILH